MADGGDRGTSYTAAWEDYRRRCRLLGAATVMATCLAVAATLLHTGDLGRAVVQFVAPAMVIVALYRVLRWPCPRCGRPFFGSRTHAGSPFAQICLHCALPKWAERDTDPAAPDAPWPGATSRVHVEPVGVVVGVSTFAEGDVVVVARAPSRPGSGDGAQASSPRVGDAAVVAEARVHEGGDTTYLVISTDEVVPWVAELTADELALVRRP